MDAFCDALSAAVAVRWRRRAAGVGMAAALLVGAGTLGAYWAGRFDIASSPAAFERGPTSEPPPVVPACNGLEAWEGHWSIMGRVVWTEYSNQLIQVRPIGLNIAVLSDCDVRVRMEKFLPGDPTTPDEFLTGETEVTPARAADGAWSLVYDLELAGDRRTYGKDEHQQFVLTLDRAPEGAPRVHGAFAKVQTETGLVLRKGWALAQRGRRPTLDEVDGHEFPCDAQCRVLCAGDEATRACVERSCAPYAEPLADPCGPPSGDFIAPLRTRAERKRLLEGRRFGAIKAGPPSGCEQNAARVLGQWQLWRVTEAGPELARLDVVPQGCLLQASLRGTDDEDLVSLSGEITEMGIWYLARDPLSPAPDTLVLAGTGPAFGIDLAEPGHLLRVFRP